MKKMIVLDLLINSNEHPRSSIFRGSTETIYIITLPNIIKIKTNVLFLYTNAIIVLVQLNVDVRK